MRKSVKSCGLRVFIDINLICLTTIGQRSASANIGGEVRSINAATMTPYILGMLAAKSASPPWRHRYRQMQQNRIVDNMPESPPVFQPPSNCVDHRSLKHHLHGPATLGCHINGPLCVHPLSATPQNIRVIERLAHRYSRLLLTYNMNKINSFQTSLLYCIRFEHAISTMAETAPKRQIFNVLCQSLGMWQPLSSPLSTRNPTSYPSNFIRSLLA